MCNKFRRNMTAVAIANEQTRPIFPSRRIKNPYQPFISKLIWSLSLLTSIKMPIQIQSWHWNPGWHDLFTFENDEWRDRSSICAYIFYHTCPLLSSRLCLVSCLWLFINNHIWPLNSSDCKSSLIHIIHILNPDIFLLDCLLKFIKPSILWGGDCKGRKLDGWISDVSHPGGVDGLKIRIRLI